MEIKKCKQSTKNSQLIKLKALKLHSKTKRINTQKVLLQTHFIKIQNIIYQYHLFNKKILFLGFSANFRNSLKNTQHKIIPEYLLFNGIINNKEAINNTIKPKLNNIDLVVINNKNVDSTVKKESYKARIPTIILKNKQKFSNKTTYSFLSNYKSLKKKKINNNFFFFMLKNIIIKAKKNKNKIQIKAQRYIPSLFKYQKEEKLYFLSKLHQKYGLSIIYDLKKHGL